MLHVHDVEADMRRNSIGDLPYIRAGSYGFATHVQPFAGGFPSPMIRVVDKKEAVVQTLHSSHAAKVIAGGEVHFGSYQKPPSDIIAGNGILAQSPIQGFYTNPATNNKADHLLASKNVADTFSPTDEQLNIICKSLKEEAEEWRQKWLASEVGLHTAEQFQIRSERRVRPQKQAVAAPNTPPVTQEELERLRRKAAAVAAARGADGPNGPSESPAAAPSQLAGGKVRELAQSFAPASPVRPPALGCQ